MINTLLHKDASQLVGQILREALTKQGVMGFMVDIFGEILDGYI